MPELESHDVALTAYVINPALAMPLVCAGRARQWMDETDQRFANRCLPLLLANQAGWFLLSAHALRISWTGGTSLDSLEIIHDQGNSPYPAISHFGHGIVTWNVPYLFKTPPGYNLLVRGPSNWPKDGIAPLEGLVETDWSVATFTVNWRMTRPGHTVSFAVGEPICMLLPQRRREIEAFAPELRSLADDPELEAGYQAWSDSRASFNAELQLPGSAAAKMRWQKHYFQGVPASAGQSGQGGQPAGDAAAAAPAEVTQGGGKDARREHQTKLSLRPFADRRAAIADSTLAAAAPRDPRARLPGAEAILRGLVVVEDFADRASCVALVRAHQRFASLRTDSDNGYALAEAARDAPEVFALARDLLGRMAAVIDQQFHASVACDLSIVCGLVRGFRHTLHADNALVFCPVHGSDAEELVRLRCQCRDVEVRPNHTPWRKYSALLYLSGDHRGGNIVFGQGPNVYGGIYLREIQVRPGLLVLCPSDELYFHQTTPIEAGTRYSMNNWFTDDPAHVCRDWL